MQTWHVSISFNMHLSLSLYTYMNPSEEYEISAQKSSQKRTTLGVGLLQGEAVAPCGTSGWPSRRGVDPLVACFLLEKSRENHVKMYETACFCFQLLLLLTCLAFSGMFKNRRTDIVLLQYSPCSFWKAWIRPAQDSNSEVLFAHLAAKKIYVSNSLPARRCAVTSSKVNVSIVPNSKSVRFNDYIILHHTWNKGHAKGCLEHLCFIQSVIASCHHLVKGKRSKANWPRLLDLAWLKAITIW